jgi:hypothetical protein
MSLDIDAKLKVFFASAPATKHQIETLEISHSAMSQVFHLWREPYTGNTSVLGVVKNMQPCNFEVKLAGIEGNLDQKFEIRLDTVDISDIFREQMERVPVDTLEKVAVTYRVFLSDDLTIPEISARLQIETISYQKGAASISVVSPRLNMTRTGEIYTPKNIPMLRAFN